MEKNQEQIFSYLYCYNIIILFIYSILYLNNKILSLQATRIKVIYFFILINYKVLIKIMEIMTFNDRRNINKLI